MAWQGLPWFQSQVLIAGAPLPPPQDLPGPELADTALLALGDRFDGELLFLPAHQALAFVQLLEILVPAFLEGRSRIAWADRTWDIEPFNPAIPAGHAVGWRLTPQGVWVLCAQAGHGACLLGTALDVFGQVHRLEGSVLGTTLDAPLFDPACAYLLDAPRLLELLDPEAARHSPALAAFLHAGLAQGALGWPVVLAAGPHPDKPNPLAGRPVAFPEPFFVPPRQMDDWMNQWGALPRLPSCPGVSWLGQGDLAPERLWAAQVGLAE
jgi:hypothetical protein